MSSQTPEVIALKRKIKIYREALIYISQDVLTGKTPAKKLEDAITLARVALSKGDAA